MADRPTPLGERPVLAGFVALLGVAVVVGLLGGTVLLSGTKILGLGGSGGSGDGPGSGAQETLFIPEPEKTEQPTGPRITLDVDPTPSAGTDPEDGDSEAEAKEKEKKRKERQNISLSSAQSAVAAMQRIDLSGSHPSGDGAILQVQRLENGTWADFPVTVSVSGGTFSTYVMTGRPGETKFRVVDTDTGKKSNPVTVTIG